MAKVCRYCALALTVGLAFSVSVAGDSAPGTSQSTIVVSVYLSTAEKPAMEIVSPNGGESWPPKSKQTIRWTSKGNVPDDLDIWLNKSGSHYKLLAKREKDDGSFTAKILPSFAKACDYTIEIFSRSKPKITDESDGPFCIMLRRDVAYVDRLAGPDGDGASWDHALNSIQAAIDLHPAQVWVAAGTYPESLVLASGTALYGGFAGTEELLSERTVGAAATIVNAGSLFEAGRPTHAAVLHGVSNVRLDGFVIAGGMARGAGDMGNGGGISCAGTDESVVIANCTIAGNSAALGGGVFLNASSPSITDCVIVGNSAQAGGGVYCGSGSAPRITRTVLANNSNYAIFQDAASPGASVTDCSFYENMDGDYFNYGGRTLTGAKAINARVAGAINNRDALALIHTGIRGAWTSAPYYDARRNITTFTDTALALSPGALAGQFLKPREAGELHGLILWNTASTVELINDWTACVQSGEGFEAGPVAVRSEYPAVVQAVSNETQKRATRD